MTEIVEQYFVHIHYTNHKQEKKWRKVVPFEIHYNSTEWHPEPQWLLKAWDVDKAAERDFAMKDIHEWQVYKPVRELSEEEFAAKVAAGKQIKLAPGGAH